MRAITVPHDPKETNMGFLDRIFGRSSDLPSEPLAPGTSMKDARAVDQYERMLRTAPPDTIERAHVEAFDKLTPEQLDILFTRFTERATEEDERPADARPASLARSAVAVETRKPGTLSKVLRPQVTETEARTQASDSMLNAWMTASLLESVAWYSLLSVAWSPWYFGWADGAQNPGAPDASDSSDATFDGDFGW
jgi:hypothetical protein